MTLPEAEDFYIFNLIHSVFMGTLHILTVLVIFYSIVIFASCNIKKLIDLILLERFYKSEFLAQISGLLLKLFL